MRKCLQIGCGPKPRASTREETWINLDILPGPGVDVVRDLRRGLPFGNRTMDHVFADNVLEHLYPDDAIFALNEIDRVLKLGGTAEIIVPHAQSQAAIQDPTHRSLWVPRSALYWNQIQTPCGGTRVGITANMMATKIEVFGDMKTEAFVRFMLRKEPLPKENPKG